MSTPSLGILVIATGRYLDFARDLVIDLDSALSNHGAITVNLFTDSPSAQPLDNAPSRVEVNPLPVPALRWPEASLYRYELFQSAAERIRGDVLVYLDADLRVRRDFTSLIEPDTWPGGLAAVQHPGFYRRRQIRPLGTWETRRESTAYVPLHRRRHYVCGGVWMGWRERVLRMSAELAARVSADADAGVTAVWHDESHWNWWVAHRGAHLLSPAMCWVPDYPWLSHLDPIIEAVDKGGDFVRESTSRELRQRIEAGGDDG